jgi:bifunctional enzyme CysN/CysC
MAGELKNFTGIDQPYEPPEAPEIHLRTVGHEPAELALEVEAFLEAHPAASGPSPDADEPRG